MYFDTPAHSAGPLVLLAEIALNFYKAIERQRTEQYTIKSRLRVVLRQRTLSKVQLHWNPLKYQAVEKPRREHKRNAERYSGHTLAQSNNAIQGPFLFRQPPPPRQILAKESGSY